MKTFSIKKNDIKHNWYIIDATNKILGRLSTLISSYLRGKHKAEYTPHMDVGDYIIVLNADKIAVTGKKFEKKIYYQYSGYVGGMKKRSFKEIFSRSPEKIIEYAVKGMLPKGILGRECFKKLKVYKGNLHNHIAQKPKTINF
ncbi:50S ribosomal protein L13 [Candidatus Tachikawaea gelatinosa]|uniref:Large ribosomal subunit protein uL13 n=1 Tax=Candidatus Tachikawaea gelatinosa TaxID=1410383 RepID=A0A090AJG2_9ENTR|nr:50S ribosomal protein L13 [Candidatus Tachikawaea gelatinosa]BAP58583.1 50S ribosomal protein L13 [Candidatus Tachikawaea gelatinosa]